MKAKGALLVAGASFVLAGCATGGGGEGAPEGAAVSAAGVAYPPGTPPEETRFSQTATLYLQRGRFERALELATEGAASRPDNPVHYFLAGVAHARLGDYRAADSMFAEAERIYPAYELDVEPERKSAWAEAFNEGVGAYAAGEVERAIDAWRKAALIYDLRPEAHRNLASVLVGEGRYDEAIEIFQRGLAGLKKRPATEVLSEDELEERRRVRTMMEESLARLLLFRERYAEAEPLFRRQVRREPGSVEARSQLARALDGQGETREAARIYSALVSEDGLEADELFDVGVALFRSGHHVEAGRAFQRLTRLRPNSRDAWFNYANALLAGRAWKELTPVADRLVELDPLSENAALISARARVETGDEPGAARRMERIDAAPVHIDALQMRPSRTGTTVQGRVVGNRAPSGTPVRVRFTFHGDGGTVGSELVTLTAPAPGETAGLEVSVGTRATGYRYEVVESGLPR